MKLIDRLEYLEKEFLTKERDNTSSIMTLIASATANGVSKAINIVKEHECIWNWVYDCSEESTHYTLSCENEYFDNYMNVESFKYCPYCGGEIEFSEVK